MENVESAKLIALVLDGEVDIEARDNALYRVLTGSLRPRLLRRFRAYEKRAPFAFEDALQEFFLYLRGDANNAYSIFRELKDASAADAWLITTFRNFVSKKSRYGVRAVAMDIPDLSDCSSRPQDEQQKVLSTMIAYCYQELPLVQRFVFMRIILTYLDRDRALPQKDVALVLGLSHVYYRVLCNRVKAFALQVKGRILAGELLLLNMNALEMRDRLDADFGGWYDLLSSYYAETINQFTQAEEINAMRYSYATDSPDMVLHDGEDFPAYTPKLSEFNTPQMPIYRINFNGLFEFIGF